MAQNENLCTIGGKNCLVRDFFARIPHEIYVETLKNVETEAIRKVLADPEERHTCDVFLRCNLNVNLASKELFMHRNTLMYRLEKIRNATGLDLRRFCDAFIFHILMFSK